MTKEHFNHELHNEHTKLPFIEYFREDEFLRNKLYAEYLKTELQPNLQLYTYQYFSYEEIQKAIKENNSVIKSKINEITTEFYKKLAEKDIEEKYYSHQLEKTKIFKNLILVDQKIEMFKNEVLNESEFKPKEEAAYYIETITRILEDINIPELTRLVLNDFINDNDNISLELEIYTYSAPKQLMEKYIKSKDLINNSISEYLKNVDNSEEEAEIKEFKFENKFDKTEPIKVYKHFYRLVDKGFLTKKDLEDFLVLAFQDLKIPKNKLSFSNLHKGDVTNIFCIYYKDIAFNTHGKKEDYSKLLGEYFNDFTTKKVMNNLTKNHKKVRN